MRADLRLQRGGAARRARAASRTCWFSGRRSQGFIILDHLHRIGEAVAELAGWINEGKLQPLETVVEGFEQLPTAINMLFEGANTGKLVVRVAG